MTFEEAEERKLLEWLELDEKSFCGLPSIRRTRKSARGTARDDAHGKNGHGNEGERLGGGRRPAAAAGFGSNWAPNTFLPIT